MNNKRFVIKRVYNCDCQIKIWPWKNQNDDSFNHQNCEFLIVINYSFSFFVNWSNYKIFMEIQRVNIGIFKVVELFNPQVFS